MKDNPVLLKPAEVASLTRKSLSGTYLDLRKGIFPHASRIGGSWRVPRASVLAVLGLKEEA